PRARGSSGSSAARRGSAAAPRRRRGRPGCGSRPTSARTASPHRRGARRLPSTASARAAAQRAGPRRQYVSPAAVARTAAMATGGEGSRRPPLPDSGPHAVDVHQVAVLLAERDGEGRAGGGDAAALGERLAVGGHEKPRLADGGAVGTDLLLE